MGPGLHGDDGCAGRRGDRSRLSRGMYPASKFVNGTEVNEEKGQEFTERMLHKLIALILHITDEYSLGSERYAWAKNTRK